MSLSSLVQVWILNIFLLLKHKSQFSHFLLCILNLSQSHCLLDTQFNLLIFYMIVLYCPYIHTNFNCSLSIHTVYYPGYFLGKSLYVASSYCKKGNLRMYMSIYSWPNCFHDTGDPEINSWLTTLLPIATKQGIIHFLRHRVHLLYVKLLNIGFNICIFHMFYNRSRWKVWNYFHPTLDF